MNSFFEVTVIMVKKILINVTMMIICLFKCISSGSFCLGLEWNMSLYVFHTYLIVCHTSTMSSYFRKHLSVCILMYQAVHKSKMFLFYLQDVHCFILCSLILLDENKPSCHDLTNADKLAASRKKPRFGASTA